MKRNEIRQLLPSILRHTAYPGSPLVALLDVMEQLHTPSEEILDNLASYLDPYQAPHHFLPYLAHWVDLSRFLTDSPAFGRQDSGPLSEVSSPFSPGMGRLRDLIASATELWQWRGTRRGLLGLLETATGIKGFEIDESVVSPSGQARPFHLLVRAPAQAQSYYRLIERILEMEKPAYVTYELQFDA
jgi:hypothetical protein